MTKRTKTEAAPEAPVQNVSQAATGKIAVLTGLLRQPGGATIEAMMAATGWQAHSVRGAISGSIKKSLGASVMSEKVDGVRTYRLATEAVA